MAEREQAVFIRWFVLSLRVTADPVTRPSFDPVSIGEVNLVALAQRDERLGHFPAGIDGPVMPESNRASRA